MSTAPAGTEEEGLADGAPADAMPSSEPVVGGAEESVGAPKALTLQAGNVFISYQPNPGVACTVGSSSKKIPKRIPRHQRHAASAVASTEASGTASGLAVAPRPAHVEQQGEPERPLGAGVHVLRSAGCTLRLHVG